MTETAKNEINQETVDKFLKEVMEIESKPLFEQGSQKTARQDEIEKSLDKILNQNHG